MDIFRDHLCLIIPNLLGKSRADLFAKKLLDNGGEGHIYNPKKEKITSSVTQCYTHIIVDPALTHTQLAKILPWCSGSSSSSCGIPIVSYKWLSKCLQQKSLVEIDEVFLPHHKASNAADDQILLDKQVNDSDPDSPPPAKQRRKYESRDPVSACSSYDEQIQTPTLTAPTTSGDDVTASSSTSDGGGVETTPQAQLPGSSKLDKSKFICMSSSNAASAELESKKVMNVNEHTISKLQGMVDAYKSTKDKWRAFGYEKAIIALKSSKESVDTYEKALALPSVGKSLAAKIAEIADSGSLEKLEVLQSSDSLRAVQLFMRIWGVGPETANTWANQGLKTLDDVRDRVKLNSNQKIGLQYFDEFDERMQRDEVSRIENVVKLAVSELDSGLEMVTCGSYRRGKSTCGDVDILVTHPDGKSHIGVFSKLLNKLHDQGFLTDDLTVQPNMTGGMAKYLGVCKLAEPEGKHRRIDIIVTPYSQYGCCLIYFTGSAHFNRSMRLMADKMGLSLTEHALYKDVIRGPKKEIIHHGIRVHTPTEESVFTYLGIPYRPPEERDHE